MSTYYAALVYYTDKNKKLMLFVYFDAFYLFINKYNKINCLFYYLLCLFYFFCLLFCGFFCLIIIIITPLVLKNTLGLFKKREVKHKIYKLTEDLELTVNHIHALVFWV